MKTATKAIRLYKTFRGNNESASAPIQGYPWGKLEKNRILSAGKAKWGYVPHENYNLCPYVRTVLFWAPLQFLFNDTWQKFVGMLVVILAAFTGLIYHFNGLHGLKIWIVTLFLTLAVVAFFAAAIGLIWSLAKSKEYLREKGVRIGMPDTIVSFSELLMKYARTAHDGICP